MVPAISSVTSIPLLAPAEHRQVFNRYFDIPTKEMYLVLDWDGCLIERRAGEMTKAATVADIATGQIESVADVLCVCPAEGTCLLVSEDIALQIFASLDAEPAGKLAEFIESAVGCGGYADLCRERGWCEPVRYRGAA